MKKVPAALLSMVLGASLISSAFGDEHLRKLQEELRKRHLYYGNIDGEFSPALTAAIARYQRKKGFVVTGMIDRETRDSLGIPELVPQIVPRAAATPFVVAQSGDVHGTNGEQLPNLTALFASPSAGSPSIERPPLEVADIAAPPAEGTEERVQPLNPKQSAPRRFHRRAAPPKETNPLVLAYQSVTHGFRRAFGVPQQPKKKRISTRRE